MRQYPNYFTLLQFISFSLFGLTHLFYRQKFCDDHFDMFHMLHPSNLKRTCRPNISEYLLVAMLSTASIGLTNLSVANLNYVTHMMFKSCKLIPVMIGSVLIVGRQYSLTNMVACLLMSSGLVIFTFFDSKIYPDFNMKGLMFVSLALCSDAIVGNYQETLFKRYTIHNSEMIFYSYGIGSVCMFVVSIAKMEFIPAIEQWFTRPFYSYISCLIYSLLGYAGIFSVYSLIREFDALLTVTVTTLRKAFNVVLSFILFPKPFSVGYLLSGFIIFTGVCLEVIARNHSKIFSTVRFQLSGDRSSAKPLLPLSIRRYRNQLISV